MTLPEDPAACRKTDQEENCTGTEIRPEKIKETIYKITPYSTVLFEKLTVAQPVMKFPAF
jgi:hypothetical protein